MAALGFATAWGVQLSLGPAPASGGGHAHPGPPAAGADSQPGPSNAVFDPTIEGKRTRPVPRPRGWCGYPAASFRWEALTRAAASAAGPTA